VRDYQAEARALAERALTQPNPKKMLEEIEKWLRERDAIDAKCREGAPT
jgi:cytidylate kinase